MLIEKTLSKILPVPLTQLPTTLREELWGYLSPNDLAVLSLSCRFFKQLFDTTPYWLKQISCPTSSFLCRIWNVKRLSDISPMAYYGLFHAFQEPNERQLFIPKDFPDKRTAFAINASGSVMAVGDRNRGTYVWQKDGENAIFFSSSTAPIIHIATNALGSTILVATAKVAMLWEKKESIWKNTFYFKFPEGHVSSCGVNANGSVLAVAAMTGYVLEKAGNQWKKIDLVADSDGGKLVDIALDDSGSLVVTASENDRVGVWSKYKGDWKITTRLFGSSVAVNGRGSLIAVGGRDNQICIWENIKTRWLKTYTWKKTAVLNNLHTAFVSKLKVSKSGSVIISGSLNGRVCMWRRKRGRKSGWEMTALLTEHLSGVKSLAIDAFGARIGICFSDGTTRALNPNPCLSNRIILLQLRRKGQVACFYDLYRTILKHICSYLTPKESCDFVVNMGMTKYAFPTLAKQCIKKRIKNKKLKINLIRLNKKLSKTLTKNRFFA